LGGVELEDPAQRGGELAIAAGEGGSAVGKGDRRRAADLIPQRLIAAGRLSLQVEDLRLELVVALFQRVQAADQRQKLLLADAHGLGRRRRLLRQGGRRGAAKKER
jgi:hypothetical protein